MGGASKKSGKKKFTRPTLENPVMKSRFQLKREFSDKVLNLLADSLDGLYPKSVTNKDVFESLKGSDDGKSDRLEVKSKLEAVRQRRTELRLKRLKDVKSLDVGVRRAALALGMKQCIDALESGQLCAAFFDGAINHEPLRCFFDIKPDCCSLESSASPIILSLPGLRSRMRSSLGFPSACVGIKKGSFDSLDSSGPLQPVKGLEKVGGLFQYVRQLVPQTEQDSVRTVSKQVDGVKVPCKSGIVDQGCMFKEISISPRKSRKIEILKRNPDGSRCFSPGKAEGGGLLSTFDDTDFISFKK